MTAGVQYDNRAYGQVAQVFKHASTVHAVALRVVITVVMHREPGSLKQGAMVFPARVADRDHGVGQQVLEEVGTGFQCARAADGLGGDHPASGDQLGVCAQQQPLYGVVIGCNAIDRQVAARCMRFNAGFLSFGYGAQQGNAAFLVVVNAHTQIHFGCTGIGVECFVEAQDGVARSHFDVREQTHGCGSSEEEGLRIRQRPLGVALVGR